MLHTDSTSLSVARFDVAEAELRSDRLYDNPDQDVTVTVSFTSPSGRVTVVPAFHDGGVIWRARVAPDEVGAWTFESQASGGTNRGLQHRTGGFRAFASDNPGFIRPDSRNPQVFSRDDGSSFFGIGDTAYDIVTGVSDTQRAKYMQTRAQQRFNFIRFFAAATPHDFQTRLGAEQAWPWGGTREKPDYDRLNPVYFQRLERMLREMQSLGLYAEIEIFNYYTLPFTDPAIWTRAREDLWIRNLVARLSAFTTVFLWTVTNEYELYPDGKYRYDGAADDAWVERVGSKVHALDPHRHPVTAHSFSLDADGGVGQRFGASTAIDVLTQQKWGEATWTGRYREGDGAGIEASIHTDRVYGKPVVNTENGYEWLKGHSDYNQQTTSTSKARRAAWRVFVGGGAAYAAGFAGTWPGRDAFSWKESQNLSFRIESMGLASQIAHLRHFIDSTRFAAMHPLPSGINEPNLALAEEGREYVVYAPYGGDVRLDLSRSSGQFRASWFDPRNGSTRRIPTVRAGKVLSTRAPDRRDWVLHLSFVGDH